MSDIDEILEERGKEYGSFESHAEIAVQLKKAIFGVPRGWATYQAEALHMIAHKIGRIVNGNPNNIENWRDIAGYAELVARILSQTEGAIDNKVVKQIVKNGTKQDV